MVTNMKITTITFPPELKRQGEAFAEKYGLSFSELVRNSLDFYMITGDTINEILIEAMAKGQLSQEEQKRFAPYLKAILGKL